MVIIPPVRHRYGSARFVFFGSVRHRFGSAFFFLVFEAFLLRERCKVNVAFRVPGRPVRSPPWAAVCDQG